jgi:hypothetical protein
VPETDLFPSSPFSLINVFVQANTIKGNRYIDDAGKILNKYAEDYTDKEVGLSGLLLGRPKNSEKLPYNIRVDLVRIWMQFHSPSEVSQTLPKASEIVREISDIIGVTHFSRLGLRAVYFLPISLEHPVIRKFADMALGTSMRNEMNRMGGELQFETTIRGTSRDLSLLIGARTIKVPDEPKPGDFPTDGVAFDVDAYDTGVLDVARMRRFLLTARDAIEKQFDTIGSEIFEAGSR